MWIRTDENVLLNADKVTYFKIQPVYQQIETYGIMAGIKIMAITKKENIDIITFMEDELELKEAEKQIEYIFNYIAESIEDDIFKIINMVEWK